MNRSKRLFFGGAIASTVGSLGLAAWGSAIARAFITLGAPVVSPEDAQLSEVALAGAFGAFFGLGVTVGSWSFELGARAGKPSGLCLGLLAAAGVLTLISGVLVLLGTRDAARTGEALAFSMLQPQDEALAPAGVGARKMSAGYAVLLAGQVALLASGSGIARTGGQSPSSRFRGLKHGLAWAAGLLGLAVAGYLASAGFDRSQFEVVAASSPNPRPADIAACLLSLLSRTQSASIAIIVLGAVLMLTPTVYASRAESETTAH